MADRAYGRPVQFQPIGVVDDAIENGVGEGRLTDDIVPLVEGELAGDERRAAAIAVLDDFHQIAPLVGDKPVRAPVIEDQQIGLDQGAEQACEAIMLPAGEKITLVLEESGDLPERGRGPSTGKGPQSSTASV